MDDAEVPGRPFTPNHSRDWLMALVLGLALGVAVAYTVEYLDDTVKLPDGRDAAAEAAAARAGSGRRPAASCRC